MLQILGLDLGPIPMYSTKNKLSRLNVIQSILTITSNVIAVIMFIALHCNVRNMGFDLFKYSDHTDPVGSAAKDSIDLAEVSTRKEERTHILIN
jgi:hypothetical protein